MKNKRTTKNVQVAVIVLVVIIAFFFGVSSNFLKSKKEWWPPATVHAAGTKVEHPGQLPVGCNHWADQCWRDSVANGTVKFVASSATDSTGRQIVFAYFINTTHLFGLTGLYNYSPVYADTGALASQDISGGTSEVDWVVGDATGIIAHDKTTGTCSQFSFFAAGSSWTSHPIICPF